MPDHQGLIVLIAIAGMAGVTYLTRAGGLFIVSRVNPSPRFRAFLSHMPSCILVSIIVPSLAGKGPAEFIAATAAGLAAVLTRNLVASLVSGLITVTLLRNFVFV